MSVQEQRWTLHKVVVCGQGLRWGYELRGGLLADVRWPTAKLAAKAAERQWKRTQP